MSITSQSPQIDAAGLGYEITPQDIVTYTEGECWYLASVLRAMTGWTAVFLIPAARMDQEDFDHVLVRTPGGDLLDIYGVQTEAEVLARWGAGGVLVDAVSDRAVRILSWTPRTDSDLLFAAETKAVAETLLAEMNGSLVHRP